MLAKTLIIVLSMLTAPAFADTAHKPAQDTVVILHGIGHSRWNMYWVERAMKREGYATVNISYPSLDNEIPALAAYINAKLAAGKVWDRQGRVHFVTHSMGGLVARRYLDDFRADIPQEKMGRLVMIAPPNGGSEVADFLKNFPPYKWSFGPAGQQLTTAFRQTDTTVPWYETGIIAGTRGWPYFVATWLIDGEHDGRVAVEKTKMNGMKDHIALPATHSFISWKGDVHGQIKNFLNEGQFQHKI